MVDYYDQIPYAGLNEFTFDIIDRVANGLESMKVQKSGVFDCIRDRLGHIIGTMSDLRRKIVKTTSISLRQSLQQQERYLLQMKSRLLHELALNYQDKPSGITPGDDSMIHLFVQLWQHPQKTQDVLDSLEAVLSDLNKISGVAVLTIVGDSITDSWKKLNFEVKMVEAVDIVMKHLDRLLPNVSLENQCALTTFAYYFKPTPVLCELISKIVGGDVNYDILGHLFESIARFHIQGKSCCAESRKLVFDMVQSLVQEGDKWQWYPTFLKWMDVFYQQDEKLIIKFVTEHATNTNTNQFEIVLKIVDFYYMHTKSPMPKPIKKIVAIQIPWFD